MFRCNATVYAAAGALATVLAAFPLPAAAQRSTGRGAARGSAAPVDYAAAHLERHLQAARATGPIALDGRLDEPSWATAPMAENFIQNDPREGEPASYPTQVRVLYDDDAMYFGVYARDDEPGRLVVSDIKKDFNTANTDGFAVLLDTFSDARNGYVFATSPAGAKFDAQLSNEGRDSNPSWDGIWEVATVVVETGWYAELRIPFRTLKFAAADVQTWGVNFQRRIPRLNEDSYWSPVPQIYDIQRVPLAGSIAGLRGLRPGLDLRVKPYAATASSSLAGRATTGDFDAGIDAKYGVTSGLVWDFTVNTDFAQVEADEQQINLTRFNLFFPEKRDFFLENSGIFELGVGVPEFGGATAGAAGSARQQEMRPFFSRRVGLSDEGGAIPILAGTRLTGREGAYSLGVLNIQQRESGPVPGANFTALRVRRDILKGSEVGAMVLNKEADGPHYNRSAAVDASLRFGYFNTGGYVMRSFSSEAVTPTGGNHYATRVHIEYSSPGWQLQGGYGGIGGQFNDELGFVPRRAVNLFNGRFGPRLRPRRLRRWVRQTQPFYEYHIYTSQADNRLQSAIHSARWSASLQNSTILQIGADTQFEDVPETFVIDRLHDLRVDPGRHRFTEYFFLWNTNANARFSSRNRISAGDFYDGHKRTLEVAPAVKLNEHFNASVGLQLNDISLPSGSFVSKLLTTRLNYNFNTKMFFNGLVQYNSSTGQWTSNLRFNLIHRPLSDFFLVYNERRDDRTGDMISRAVIAKMTYLVAF